MSGAKATISVADDVWVTAAPLAARVPFAWLGYGGRIHSIVDDG